MGNKWRLTGQLSIGEQRIGETPTYEVLGRTVEEATKAADEKWIAAGMPRTFYNGAQPTSPYTFFWRKADD